jgi:N-acetylmuramoyl-L-alanine amidase
MSDYPEAVEYLVDESRVFIDQNSHSAITIHGTGGNASQTAQQLGDWFRGDPAMASSHYGIDRSGVVCQYVLEKDGAAANCCKFGAYDPFWDQFNGENLNIHTISIEHENDSSNSLPLSQAQQDASFKLVAYLCQKYAISSSNIKTHASIDPINRARCPGNYPMDALISFVDNGATQPLQEQPTMIQIGQDMGMFFTDSGNNRWHCGPKNVDFIGENLNFWRSNNGLGGLPLTNEIYLAQYPGTAIVVCERWIQVYDPIQNGKRQIDNPPGAGVVYLLHLDSGVGQQMIAKALTDALQSQIDTLKAQLAVAKAPQAPTAQLATLQAKLQQIHTLSA